MTTTTETGPSPGLVIHHGEPATSLRWRISDVDRSKILNEIWDADCAYAGPSHVPLEPRKSVRAIMATPTGDIAYVSNSLPPEVARAVARAIIMAPRMLNLLEYAVANGMDNPEERTLWLEAASRTIAKVKNQDRFANER